MAKIRDPIIIIWGQITIIVCTINSFGKNPKRGGSPAKEKIAIIKFNFSKNSVLLIDGWLMNSVWVLFKIKIAIPSIRQYIKKYINHVNLLIIIAASIQLELVIEENVIIFLIELEVIPPNLPIKAEVAMMMGIKRSGLIIDNSQIGAIFCHDSIIIICVQFKLQITWGNHKWVGAKPAFTIRAKVSKVVLLTPHLSLIVESCLIAVKIIKDEEIAWIIKYLIAASVIFVLFLKIKIGKILIILISSPSQAVTHDEAEMTMKVLARSINKNKLK